MSNYSKRFTIKIKDFLNGEGWVFNCDEDAGYFEFNLTIGGKVQKIFYSIYTMENGVLFTGSLPIGADIEDERIMVEMAEFISRVNSRFIMGSFCLDYKTGEIAFKRYLDCSAGIILNSAIDDSIGLIATAFSKYSPGMADIIFDGTMSARDALNITDTAWERAVRMKKEAEDNADIVFDKPDKAFVVKEGCEGCAEYDDESDLEESDDDFLDGGSCGDGGYEGDAEDYDDEYFDLEALLEANPDISVEELNALFKKTVSKSSLNEGGDEE